MGDVVFVNLDHSPPRALFVIQFGFTTDSDDSSIVCRACYKSIEGVRRDAL